MRRFTIDIIFFAVVCLQRLTNMWEGNKRLSTMYEKCNNIVEMLTVITEGNMVSWERIGANEYKVPVARNYVALEYRKSEGFEDSPLTHLWGQAPRSNFTAGVRPQSEVLIKKSGNIWKVFVF